MVGVPNYSNRMHTEQSEVFISYSRTNKPFVQQLHEALESRERPAWVDWDGIPPTAEWMSEIYAAIEAAQTVVFVMSAAALASEICNKELEHAVTHRKRLVPIVCDDIDAATVPESLAKLNWIYVRAEDDFTQAFEQLIGAMDSDLEWVRDHTRLLVRAIEWRDEASESSLLLRGNDLSEAEQWLASAVDKEPKPTELQANFILAGRANETKRSRQLLTGVVFGLLVAVCLAIIAVFQYRQAEQARVEEEHQRLIADERRREAETRKLSFAAQEQRGKNDQLALLLAVEGARLKPLPEFRELLRRGIANRGQLLRVFAGYEEAATYVSWNAAGTHIVSSSFDFRTRIWDVHTGLEIQKLKAGAAAHATWSPSGHAIVSGGAWENTRTLIWPTDDGVHTAGTPRAVSGLVGRRASWSADSTQLVAVDRDGRLWVVDTKTTSKRPFGDGITHHHAAWSPDGRFIAGAGKDGVARIWRVTDSQTDGQLVGEFHGHTEALQFVAWKSDSSQIVTASEDRTARIWNVTRVNGSSDSVNRSPVRILAGHSGSLTSASWNRDDTMILTASQDQTVRVWDAATGAELALLAGHAGPVMHAGWSPASDLIATSSTDRTVRLWDPNDRDAIMLDGHVGTVWPAAWNDDESRVLTVDPSSGRAQMWNGRHGSKLFELIAVDGAAHAGGTQSPTWTPGWFAVFEPGGERVLTPGLDGVVRLWRADNGTLLQTLRGHSKAITHAAWSPNGEIVTTSEDRTARIWNKDGSLRHVLHHGRRVFHANWSPDGSRIATTNWTSGPAASVWDARDGRKLFDLNHGDGVWKVEWSRDGSKIVTSANNDTAQIWNAENGRRIHDLRHPGEVTHAVFDSTGRRVATACGDNIVRIFTDGKLERELTGHSSSARYVDWSKDDQYLVSAGQDGTARVWDVHTGDQIDVLTGHTEWVRYAKWNKAGTRILTAGDDGSARIHYLELDDLLEAACTRIVRNMTEVEWATYMGEEVPYRPTCDGASGNQEDVVD